MKILLIISLIFSFLIVIPSTVNAWGKEGHETVGQIAQNILRPDIAKKVGKLLKEYEGQLAPAAVWADQVKFKYPWSKKLHYMDTIDDPGKSCSVNKERDCPNNICVVGAIVNYTEQLDCKNKYDANTRSEALRFLAHFLGDLTQPLHVSGRENGGNGVPVKWRKAKKKLHGIWDKELVEKRLQDFNSDYVEYAKFLTGEIENGAYASEAKDWVSCLVRAKTITEKCTISWATDTNKINCPFVWDTVDENPNLDLSQGYYKAAVPIIDKQIAKGGYRLGTFLNLIFSRCS